MKNRKANRMKGYDYSRNNLYFITNCVKENLCCLGEIIRIEKNDGNDATADNPEYEMLLNEYGKIVNDFILWLAEHFNYVVLHNHQVMPNHLHILLEIDRNLVQGSDVKIKTLSNLMGAFKTVSSKGIHEAGFEDFAWHRSFHDHIIRDEKSYHNIFNYISNNPQKWFEDKFYKEK